jgi:pimeloyl-ACP methyl ester carboxylesterase
MAMDRFRCARFWLGLLFIAVTIGCPSFLRAQAIASKSFVQLSSATEKSENKKAAKVIVFVHGFGGDAKSTWTSPTGTSWFSLMKDDPGFAAFDVYSIGYFSPLVGKASDIDEIATRVLQTEILDTLLTNYEEAYFIAHSMGGLVLKRALVKLRGNPDRDMSDKLHKVGAVIFISTPSAGAKLGDWASWFSFNPQLQNMKTEEGATYLNSVDSDWRQLLKGRPSHRLFPRSLCAYETLPTHGVKVVPKLYSEAACDIDAVGFDFDHVQIAKPLDRDNLVYRWVTARISETSAKFEPYISPGELEDKVKRYLRLPFYYSDALKYVKIWLRIEPENARANYYAAVANFKLKNYVDAISAADTALQLKPNDSDTLFVKGAVLMRMGDYKAAKDLWQARVSNDPTHAGARLNLAESSLALDEMADAKRNYSVLVGGPDTRLRRQPLLGLGIIELIDPNSTAFSRTKAINRFREVLCVDSNLRSVFFGKTFEDADDWFDVYAEKIAEIRSRQIPEYVAFLKNVTEGKAMCTP